jgi:hypothetical protein
MSEKTDDMLVEALMERMTAHELRSWAVENGVDRSRGDSKRTTAEKAVEQSPRAVLDLLGEPDDREPASP